MAVFGSDFYGTTTYGLALGVEYDVSPFVVSPIDYGVNSLSWSTPTNSFAHFRLLRSTVGPAVRYDDGQLLGDDTSIGSSAFIDGTAVPGATYYYTLFFEDNSNNWWSAGSVSCLTLKNHGYADALYNLVPRYYRQPADDLVEAGTENADLQGFLKVIGWGFDDLKSYYESLLRVNDATTTNVGNLHNIAEQFGVPFHYTTSVRNMRKFIGEWSNLMREKGTAVGLEAMIRAATGWDSGISTGYNLMLDEDQASFVNPSYPAWDSNFSYITGDRVTNNGFLYQASQAAYGAAQAPPTSATSNTWWTYVTNTADTTQVNSATGNPGTWQAINYDTQAALSSAIQIGVGFQSPTDGTVNYSNTLQTKYTGASANVALRSISYLTGQSTMDAYQPVLDGIPVPVHVTNEYDPTVKYEPGAFVYYAGFSYRALIATQGVAPTATIFDNTNWQCMGIDKQTRLAVSAYCHTADFSGTNTGVQCYPFIEFYDKNGTLITRVNGLGMAASWWDSFSYPWGALAGTTPSAGQYGGSTWTVSTGAFTRFNGLNGCVSPADQTVRSMAFLDVGSANGKLYVTFRTSVTSGSLSQCLLMRATDTSNYIKATRSKLVSVQGGVATVLATYSKSAGDNDRLQVTMNGSSYTVYVNGTQVATASSSFNSTATKVGLGVDPTALGSAALTGSGTLTKS